MNELHSTLLNCIHYHIVCTDTHTHTVLYTRTCIYHSDTHGVHIHTHQLPIIIPITVGFLLFLFCDWMTTGRQVLTLLTFSPNIPLFSFWQPVLMKCWIFPPKRLKLKTQTKYKPVSTHLLTTASLWITHLIFSISMYNVNLIFVGKYHILFSWAHFSTCLPSYDVIFYMSCLCIVV